MLSLWTVLLRKNLGGFAKTQIQIVCGRLSRIGMVPAESSNHSPPLPTPQSPCSPGPGTAVLMWAGRDRGQSPCRDDRRNLTFPALKSTSSLPARHSATQYHHEPHLQTRSEESMNSTNFLRANRFHSGCTLFAASIRSLLFVRPCQLHRPCWAFCVEMHRISRWICFMVVFLLKAWSGSMTGLTRPHPETCVRSRRVKLTLQPALRPYCAATPPESPQKIKLGVNLVMFNPVASAT